MSQLSQVSRVRDKRDRRDSGTQTRDNMKKNYRYHLLKYKDRNSRFRCPNCGRPHCFTPYVDENDVPVDVERYGRCDHEQSCGVSLRRSTCDTH